MSKKNPSRQERISIAVANILTGVDELESLREEYQDWLDGMPENLQDGATGEKLTEVIDLLDRIDEIRDTADEIDGADLPLGFGRD